MYRNLLSIFLALGVIVTSLIIRGALLSEIHYGEAQAALVETTEILSESDEVSWHQARASVLKSVASQPARVLEISSGDVLDLLREPEFIRHEHKTQMWQYRTQACVLDLYFSEKGEVIHYEMRARDRAVSDTQVQGSCMGDLVAQNAAVQVVDAVAAAAYKMANNAQRVAIPAPAE